MALDLVDYEQKAREAVKAFWGNREAARQKQIEAGKADQGDRANVTAGKNMDGFLALIIDIVQANGLANAEIHQNRAILSLPGYFRPTKLWDLLIISPHFPVFEEFQEASYLRRYDLLCQKLVKEQLYTTAALITSSRSAVENGEFTEMSAMMGLRTFVTALAGHAAAESARLE